jgi:hypothetical protein
MNIVFASPFEVLLKGLEKETNQQAFGQKSVAFLESVFERILSTADTIQWKRTPRGLEGEREVHAGVRVKNYTEEEVIIPVVLSVRDTLRKHVIHRVVSLRLGGHNGPPKYGDDPRVRELATRVFGVGDYC